MGTQGEQDSIEKGVLKALAMIRPYLEADGGDVKLVEITDEQVVMVELLGACGTCPMSIQTLKAGVEQVIKQMVPEIQAVQAVNLTLPDDPRAVMPG